MSSDTNHPRIINRIILACRTCPYYFLAGRGSKGTCDLTSGHIKDDKIIDPSCQLAYATPDEYQP